MPIKSDLSLRGFYKLFIRLNLLIIFFPLTIYSQSPESLWQDIQPDEMQSSVERTYTPDRYRLLRLDFSKLKQELLKAPHEDDNSGERKELIISIPLPDGTSELFSVLESPVMHPDLAANFPMIRTFSAQNLRDPRVVARLDFTEWGFHAMIISQDSWVFIEPFSQGNLTDYISYFKKDSKQRAPFECAFSNGLKEFRSEISGPDVQLRTSGANLKTYRLVVACTGEYTSFHGGTVSGALSAIVTSVNRVTGVYQIEVAVRLQLVANNNLVIYTNSSTDPYSNTNGSAMLSQNQSTVDGIIGSANYDIGHVFSTGGGGVAYLESVCSSSLKAGGVTGSGSPVGDAFDIDYVAHEMGHQFGAEHTFNSVTGSCSGGNRESSCAYEPGSGTTIMAYAGICGADNIQPNSDPVFHTKSFDQIQTFITTGSGNSCDVQTSTGNTPPVVNAGANYTIPYLTPFILTGSATDADGDPLTYLWEEYDLGPSGTPNSPSGNAPIFRVFTPTSSPSRTFPRIQDLVRNQQTLGEILPSYARSLQFKFTARDNRSSGGGVGNNDTPVTLTVVNTGSAFAVTSPNTNVSWTGLTSQTVTWNVSGTNASPINCANVNILLSVDSGYTFPYTLVSNTPNDGSQTISVPNIAGTKNRIKVESVGNIFFDMSNVNFTIVAGTGVLTSISTDPLSSNNMCAGGSLTVGFTANGIPNAGNNYTVQLSNPSGSFTSGVTNIGSLLNSTVSSGSISCTLPSGISGNTYRIRVVSSNPAVDGTDNGSNIIISLPVGAAGSISGSTAVCQGQTGVVYSVAPIANATSYVWTIPSGATITGGANTNSITVSYSGSAASGNLTVRGSNLGCGNGSVSAPLAISVSALPSAAGAISGPASVCPATGGHIYSVPAISGAVSYNWTLPAGATISGGAGTNSVTLAFSSLAVSGTISVSGVNTCGSGTASAFSLTVYAVPPAALVTPAGPLEICPSSAIMLSHSQTGGTDYQWRKNGVNIPGESGSVYNANSSGTYDVTAVYSSAAPQSFSNMTSVSIPDNSCTGASSTISVSGYSASVPASGISVQLNITHTWDGDLVIILETPAGSLLGLSNRVGSSGDNFTNTVFSDAGSAQIPSSGAPYTGTYKPWASIFTSCVTTSLTTFSAINAGSVNPNGNWKLWVYDRANLDFGTLDNWTINFPSSVTGTCASVSNSVIVTLLNPVSISGFSPATGSPGTPVQINGGDFTGTSAVYFNGVSASFTVNNASLITAIVPAGALSGTIEVTGVCGSIFSASAFNVTSGDVSLNLKVYIEGFYRGSGQMVSVLGSSKCDTIEVSLADPVAPHNLLYTSKGVLDLSGVSNFIFTGAAQKPYYYIVVKHRNSLEVWSGDSVSFVSLNVAYDFTNAADKAYGSVQTDLGGGFYGMFSGDIDQNGVINDVDMSLMQTAIQSFQYGYYVEDLSGDNYTETADYSLLENNAVNSVTAIKP